MRKVFIATILIFVTLLVGCSEYGQKAKHSEPTQKELTGGIFELKQNSLSDIINNSTEDSPITVIVNDKYNQERIKGVTYYDYILFDVTVKNNTDEPIKAIQGTLICNDIFNNMIILISWDFTDEIIDSHNEFKQIGYGIEYNQFKDDHKKLWNTEFDYLIFEYVTSQIIFENGETLDY